MHVFVVFGVVFGGFVPLAVAVQKLVVLGDDVFSCKNQECFTMTNNADDRIQVNCYPSHTHP